MKVNKYAKKFAIDRVNKSNWSFSSFSLENRSIWEGPVLYKKIVSVRMSLLPSYILIRWNVSILPQKQKGSISFNREDFLKSSRPAELNNVATSFNQQVCLY